MSSSENFAPAPLLGTGSSLLQVVHQLVGPEPPVVLGLHQQQHPEDRHVGVGGAHLLRPDRLRLGRVLRQVATLCSMTRSSRGRRRRSSPPTGSSPPWPCSPPGGDTLQHDEVLQHTPCCRRDICRHCRCSHWSPSSDTADTPAHSYSWDPPPCQDQLE